MAQAQRDVRAAGGTAAGTAGTPLEGGSERAELPSRPVRVRMVHQLGHPRYDGRAWPAPGEEFEVPEWEAAELTRLDEHHSVPVAELADGGDPWELESHGSVAGPGAAPEGYSTHRRMGVEDRDWLPGHGEPAGTPKSVFMQEMAEAGGVPDAAETWTVPPEAAEGAQSGAAQERQAAEHGPQTAGGGVPANAPQAGGAGAAPQRPAEAQTNVGDRDAAAREAEQRPQAQREQSKAPPPGAQPGTGTAAGGASGPRAGQKRNGGPGTAAGRR